VVVSRALASACRDRQNYWRTLQELAGVRNRYVEQAIERTQAAEREQARLAQEQLMAEHQLEREQIRATAAGEAMQRLADLLLGLDLTSAPQSAVSRVSTKAPAAAAQSVEKSEGDIAPIAQQPAAPTVLEDSWIDTPLCTSCNDCFKVNPLLFTYNEDKQVMLGDLSKGRYAQLVQAAELCPAHCIHPGQPWDPNESGLAEWVERARRLA
jgi:ferredoxin